MKSIGVDTIITQAAPLPNKCKVIVKPIGKLSIAPESVKIWTEITSQSVFTLVILMVIPIPGKNEL